ncbi:MAG: hypothetical protein GXO73_07895 [Calditrichaeota bacterium]|nr:hypothetical protein [Calditrichota bacterium]
MGGIGAALAMLLGPPDLEIGTPWSSVLRVVATRGGPTIVVTVVALAVLVFPGFALMRWFPGRDRGIAEEFAVAVLLSILTVGALGSVLTAFRFMSRGRLALLVLVTLLIGFAPAVRWLKRCYQARPVMLAGVGVLAIPWVWFAAADGFPPASTFQWWYWDLGRYLTEARGIPSWVAEYGTQVRWLPDYVVFNLLSEAYAGLGSAVSDDSLMQYWKVSVVLVGLVMAYLVFRLWVGPLAGFVGLAGLAASSLWTSKFNAYKPEALGLVVGFACVWLLVRGLRERRVELVYLAGAGIGVDMAIHGVAATVLGLLMLAAALAELIWSDRGRRRDMVVLTGAAVLALVFVVAIGVGLQGRAVVAGDALNPEVSTGVDPTWEFLQLADGSLDPGAVPTLSKQIESNLERMETPWGRTLPVKLSSLWFALPTITGLALLWRVGNQRGRAGLLTLFLFAGLLTVSAAFFAVSFDTFVPRHTGLSRMSQYVPLAVAVALALATEGYRLALNRWKRLHAMSVGDIVGAGVLGFSLVLGVAVPLATYQGKPALTEVGRDGIDALRIFSTSGDRVLANATTRGVIESLSRVDSLLEGRQPLIEDPEFLTYTNETLRSAMEYLRSPAGNAFATKFGVRWLLISDDPALLGAKGDFGGSPEQFEALPNVRLVWSTDGVALFETGVTSRSPRFGPAETYRRSLAVGSVIIVIGLFGTLGLAHRFGWTRKT